MVVTVWDSLDAVEAFAGRDFDHAFFEQVVQDEIEFLQRRMRVLGTETPIEAAFGRRSAAAMSAGADPEPD